MNGHSEFFEKIKDWGKNNIDIKAIGLAGSYARGEARTDSDIDLIVLSDTPEIYAHSSEWIGQFGSFSKRTVEDWGAIQSVRVLFDFAEIEFGFGKPSWANAGPLDKGTMSVIQGGFEIIYDPENILARICVPSL